MNKRDEFTAVPDDSVTVSGSRPKSKTWAIRHLSKYFVRPVISNATTPEDREAGQQRLRLFCHSRVDGHRIGVVEVSGPPDALPKAILVAACRRIGVKVTFDHNGGATFVQGAVPLPKPMPAEVVTPNPNNQPVIEAGPGDYDAR